jgi:hypothetical protein
MDGYRNGRAAATDKSSRHRALGIGIVALAD